ncbi:MAG: hypothetical protein COA54_04275 [Thiotrichaceae bacterium]|nr:MAG: hypothetical protein COA54_04275 [Thiotrichaceae bacterium]
MAKQKKRTGRTAPKKKKEQGTNFADVVIRLTDALYDLAQTGNLIGLILFGFIVWVFYVTYKLPPEVVAGFLGNIGSFIASESFYWIPLSSALAVSVFANFIQAKVYRSHIQDLSEHRKYLVHGLESGDLKPLGKHHSSDFDVKNDN